MKKIKTVLELLGIMALMFVPFYLVLVLVHSTFNIAKMNVDDKGIAFGFWVFFTLIGWMLCIASKD